MVNPTQQGLSDEERAWGAINGGGFPSLKFAYESFPGSKQYVDFGPGTAYEGVLTENPVLTPVMDYDSGEPKLYKSGDPVEDLRITLQTGLRDPEVEDDSGIRRWFAGRQGKEAIRTELKRLGIKRFGVGTHIRIEHTGYAAQAPGQQGRPARLYTVTLSNVQEFVSTPQAQVDASLNPQGVAQGQAPGQPIAQQQWAQQAPAQAPQQQFVQPQVSQYQQPPAVAQQPVQQFAQPAAPQQPVQAPVAPQAPQAAQQPVAQPAAPVDPAVLLQQQLGAVPAAGDPGYAITPEIAANLETLAGLGVPRPAAIASVAGTHRPGDAAFVNWLEANVPF